MKNKQKKYKSAMKQLTKARRRGNARFYAVAEKCNVAACDLE